MSVISVMVTGIGGGGVGEQILKCLKISKLSYFIIGCDINKISKGFSQVDRGYIVPQASDKNYIDAIVGICKKDHIQILFPGSEPELKLISKNRHIFQDLGVCIPLNSQELIDICMDKNRTMDFLKKEGFSLQKYWEIRTKEDLENVNIYPVVMKPSIGGGGSVNTFIAQNDREVRNFGEYLLEFYDQFIVQEYVGDAQNEYTVGVFHNLQGEYINAIAVKKNIMSGLSNKMKIPNKTGRSELGSTLAISSGVSQGEIGRFDEVIEPSRKIAAALGATAAINIQCRVHNGNMYVFEINPRISGTSSLRALVGYNEPELLIREYIMGEDLRKDFEYGAGYITRGLSEEFIDNDLIRKITI